MGLDETSFNNGGGAGNETSHGGLRTKLNESTATTTLITVPEIQNIDDYSWSDDSGSLCSPVYDTAPSFIPELAIAQQLENGGGHQLTQYQSGSLVSMMGCGPALPNEDENPAVETTSTDGVYSSKPSTPDEMTNTVPAEISEARKNLDDIPNNLLIQHFQGQDHDQQDQDCAKKDYQIWYEERTKQIRLYSNTELHCLVLNILLSLLVHSDGCRLDPFYTEWIPLTNSSSTTLRENSGSRINVIFYLYNHLSHADNCSEEMLTQLRHNFDLFQDVQEKAYGKTVARADERLFTLLCPDESVNEQKKYQRRIIANGAFGTVYELSMEGQASIASKVMDVPRHIHERCVLYTLFSEVSALELLQECNSSAGTIMHSYGVSKNLFNVDSTTKGFSYWIHMEKCVTSLRHWRQIIAELATASLKESVAVRLQEGKGDEDNEIVMDSLIPVLLDIYLLVLDAVRAIHSCGITHYDIKCDNIFFRKLPREGVQCEICLGDFGESRSTKGAYAGDVIDDIRDRGTECIKSPEMLLLYKSKTEKNINVLKKKKKNNTIGTSIESDIWSLGCLLYEILTGCYLFADEEWIQFFMRVTHTSISNGEKLNIFSKKSSQKIEEMTLSQSVAEVLKRDLDAFLQQVLVREKADRLSIAQMRVLTIKRI
eukprot:g877.t1